MRLRPFHPLVLSAALAGLMAGCGGRPVPPPDLPTPPVGARSADPDRAGGVYHEVIPGQTLWRIARAYGLSLEELAAANGIEDPTVLEVGRRLWVPGAPEILSVEPYRPETAPAAPRGRFSWPVSGAVGSPFGMRNGRRHTGIDIVAPTGSPVRAARDGTVWYAGSQYRGYGNLVILDHGDGYRTYYAHNRDNLVKKGQRVSRGERIARVGQTGNASGPHLHFEIRRGNHLLDPVDYLGGSS